MPDALASAELNPGACFSKRPRAEEVTFPELYILFNPPAKASDYLSDSFN